MTGRPYRPGPIGERVARNLRVLREARGWTQLKVQRQLMQDFNHYLENKGVHRFENGTRRPTPDDLVAFAALYQVTLRRLLLDDITEETA